jgi:hypothetical protein
MNVSEKIETIGVLLKRETLQSVEHFVLENTLVLESLEPFPGYHGENLPQEPYPNSLFFITDKTYPVEKIFRVSQHLCCDLGLKIDACPVEITIYNTVYPGIRVRGLNQYSMIPETQACYIKKGIGFLKYFKIHEPALMRIVKMFVCEKIDPFILRDIVNANTYYLTIPYHFSWEQFREVTHKVKNNMYNNNFDAAVGYLYLSVLTEFVRIFDYNPGIEKLTLIREKYLDEIKRIQQTV